MNRRKDMIEEHGAWYYAAEGHGEACPTRAVHQRSSFVAFGRLVLGAFDGVVRKQLGERATARGWLVCHPLAARLA